MELDGFDKTTFEFGGKTRDVYSRGAGPSVVILHELPGLTPEAIRFARRVAEAEFHVVLPVLFGKAGKPLSTSYFVREFAAVCLRREIHLLASRRSSPITDWLRALCRSIHNKRGGPGVGVVGMCATGGIALALLADEAVLTTVASQPSLPLTMIPSNRSRIDVSQEELAIIRKRSPDRCRALGLRFSCDRLCPAERFETLRRELGERFESLEIDSSAENVHGIKQSAHSVLTLDFVEKEGHPTRAALGRVVRFLRERLMT